MKLKKLISLLVFSLLFSSCQINSSSEIVNQYSPYQIIDWLNELEVDKIDSIMISSTPNLAFLSHEPSTKYYYEEKEQINQIFNLLKLPLKKIEDPNQEGGPSIEKMVIKALNQEFVLLMFGNSTLFINGEYYDPIDNDFKTYRINYYSRKVISFSLSMNNLEKTEFDLYKNGELIKENQQFIDDFDLMLYEDELVEKSDSYYLKYEDKITEFEYKSYIFDNKYISMYYMKKDTQNEVFIGNYKIVNDKSII